MMLSILFATAAIHGALAQAGLPSVGPVFQIQPTFRGSFPRTPCLTVFDAANSSAVLINDCSAGTQQRAFRFDQPPGTVGQIHIFNTFCLEPEGDFDGAKVSIQSCVDGDARQTWIWGQNGEVQWGQLQKMCLDLTDGVLTNGNQVQIWTCDFASTGGPNPNPNQRWNANDLANPVAEVANKDVCLGAASSDNGSPVRGVSCQDASARKVWVVPQAGHGNRGTIHIAFGDDGTAPIKCLDVTDGVNANGTKLQLWDCTDNNPNQDWFPTGVEIQWSGAGGANPMCIDLTDGVVGNQVQIWGCTGGPNNNQLWSSVPPPQADV